MKQGHLSSESIERKVDAMITRLKLTGCKDTMVGGLLMKGLSGGERKRASIGYELITSPSLLLLDEPTSGLDSHTASQICQLLKQETLRGMTIIATIHQPSAETFTKFDRVIILASGHTIYNASTKTEDIKCYFNQINIPYSRFSNPSDTLLKLANAPRFMNKRLTIPMLQDILAR